MHPGAVRHLQSARFGRRAQPSPLHPGPAAVLVHGTGRQGAGVRNEAVGPHHAAGLRCAIDRPAGAGADVARAIQQVRPVVSKPGGSSCHSRSPARPLLLRRMHLMASTLGHTASDMLSLAAVWRARQALGPYDAILRVWAHPLHGVSVAGAAHLPDSSACLCLPHTPYQRLSGLTRSRPSCAATPAGCLCDNHHPEEPGALCPAVCQQPHPPGGTGASRAARCLAGGPLDA